MKNIFKECDMWLVSILEKNNVMYEVFVAPIIFRFIPLLASQNMNFWTYLWPAAHFDIILGGFVNNAEKSCSFRRKNMLSSPR